MLTLAEIETMNLKQLRQAAKHRLIKGYTTMNKGLLKEKLIEFLKTQSALPAYLSTTPSVSYSSQSEETSKSLSQSETSVTSDSEQEVVLPAGIKKRGDSKTYLVSVSYRGKRFGIGSYKELNEAKEDLSFALEKKNEFENLNLSPILLDKYDFIQESKKYSRMGCISEHRCRYRKENGEITEHKRFVVTWYTFTNMYKN